MSKQITTLNQAAEHLIQQGAVDMTTMTVEGLMLLEVCGFRTESDVNKSIDRQIAKHKFVDGVDYTLGINALSKMRAKQYKFTLNAANHVLLAAMTENGKLARQDAIDTKTETQPVSTGNLMLDALIESQRQISEVKAQVDETAGKVAQLELQTAIMPCKPSNAVSITEIRKTINERHGLPQWVITDVINEMAYSPKPVGQVRNDHAEANNSTYTVWYKVDVTKLFQRFTSECVMVTDNFAMHAHFDKRFKLTDGK